MKSFSLSGSPFSQSVHPWHRVLFGSISGLITHLTDAHNHRWLKAELSTFRRYKILVVVEVGCIAFDHDPASLTFQLASSRYECGLLILTSNLAFSLRADIFGCTMIF